MLTGKQNGPAGGANGVGNRGACKNGALLSQPVYVGSRRQFSQR
jgi:hypothetical protein